MPEGDSVYQLARRLQFMVGRTVLRCSLRVPSVATVDLAGSPVRRVWPYGKHLFHLIGEDILHTHLKMEGTWAMHLAGDRWTRPGHTARVVLTLDGAPHPRPLEVVGHNLGLVEVFPATAYSTRMGYLGPDVLGQDWPDWGRQEAIRRLGSQPDRPIGTALLDQHLLAGVGNEYRAEICFIAGVHPATPVSAVDLEQVVDITRRLMWSNKDSPLRVTTGVRRAGESSYVFGRRHRPCRRCGSLILSANLGGPDAGGREGELERIIWWCPRCQPAPVDAPPGLPDAGGFAGP
ncbi:DNA-formamidopyrimidine glycosylase family protein [Corynebacterium uberis]|uniref:DNA-formamidopyrimidine glycosylase family protein n=1 Tax=Corynebacterium TaxID=1716 RepID=UPI001D09DA9B|nr:MULTISPECIES: DNA-formamidopyrimidine glycosylase family protein [Corynebacterium]MCZ9308754.1 Fpg/Nei family DNA glycosylase [Corynebacterium sp. c6VSa_13]UDL72715.1 Fpg/Nei family DNA glycosylase [Corynebacterium uberis]UDL76409.1 Fpg/Nei family DNA glycosylase [Corynebacterium uberis]UDL78621.1 Fpg/Nei family DNA glycosylase [Corynebacterium uberis]UDL80900.1 Fpg/Nei family DNA glycosylase [Corynebacterium uberis]